MFKKFIGFFSFVIILFGLDRMIKYLAEIYLLPYKSIQVIPGFFDLTLAFNHGAAFSFLAGGSGWQRWFFVIVAIIVCSIVFYWVLNKTISKLEYLALGLLTGGALGNLWDRVNYGYVIDYLDFYLQNYHWPVFNLADIFIVVSLLLLVFSIFKTSNY